MRKFRVIFIEETTSEPFYFDSIEDAMSTIERMNTDSSYIIKEFVDDKWVEVEPPD